jgi:PPP family 3-phenylpropionic acid transporter
LIRRLRPYGLLMLSLVIIGLRTLHLVASRTPGQVLAVQLLNGLAFPAFWVAGVSYADADAPPGMTTTAQGLFGAVVAGIGTALGGLVGGPLLESSGGQGLFSVFGVAVLAAAAIAMLIQARLGAEPRTSPGVADG